MGDVSRLDQVGLALGTSTYGTAAASFTRGLLVSEFTANPPSQTVEPVGEIRGDYSVRRVTKGPLDHDVSLGFPLDVGDAASAGIGDFLAAMLGTDGTTDNADGTYDHKIQTSEDDTPPWLNLWSDKDATNRQFTGFRPTEISFEINSDNGHVPVTVSGIAKDESDLTSTQTLTFSDEPLIRPSEAGTFTVGGSSVTNFSTCTITLTSDVERFRPVSDSRTIGNGYKKNIMIAVSLSGLNFASETERDKFTGVSSSAFELKLTDTGSNYINFVFPETYYRTWEGPNLSGEDLKTISAEMFVTGAYANWYIEIMNTFGSNYATGAAI